MDKQQWSSGDIDASSPAATTAEQLLPRRREAAALPFRPPTPRTRAPQSPDAVPPSCDESGPKAPAQEMPWRRRRSHSWNGAWREDPKLRRGMSEMMEALQYPWAIRATMKVSPGPSWIITNMSDDGHTLVFDTNSAVLNRLFKPVTWRYFLDLFAVRLANPNKVSLLQAPVTAHYGDSDETAPRYEQPPFIKSFASRTTHAWWDSPTTLIGMDEWVESEEAYPWKAIRGKRCWARNRLTFHLDGPHGCCLQWEETMFVEGLTPPEGGPCFVRFLRREGPPPEPIATDGK